MTSEATLLAEATKALEALGCHVERNNAGTARRRGHHMRLHTEGCPDIVVLAWRGRTVWIELKRDEREEPSDEQVKWHAMAARLGHKVHVCWTVQQVIDAVTRERKAR
jgi:hypothetical protein